MKGFKGVKRYPRTVVPFQWIMCNSDLHSVEICWSTQRRKILSGLFFVHDT